MNRHMPYILRKCITRKGKRICHPTGYYRFWVAYEYEKTPLLKDV
jgi:hypothetical protein